MGALVGGMYALGKDVAYMQKLVSKFNSIGNFSLISTLFKGNILNIDKVKKIFNQEFKDIKHEETPIKFVCVATDMKSGKPMNFESGTLKENVMASISIPGIFPSVKIGDRTFSAVSINST